MNEKLILASLVLAGCILIVIIGLIGIIGLEGAGPHEDRTRATAPESVASGVRKLKRAVTKPTARTVPDWSKSTHTHQYQTSQMLLPKQTPWQVVHDELLPLARSGNAAAAARLYRDTRACVGYFGAIHNIKKFTLTREFVDSTPAFIVEDVEARLAEQQRYLDTWRPVCSGVEQATVSGAVYEATLLAADLGNRSAACSYVSASQFQVSDTFAGMSVRDHYLEHVAQILNEGLEQGHWEMVVWLLSAYAVNPNYHDRAWLDDLIKPNAFAAYTYTLLMQYGAGDGGTGFADQLAHNREIGNLTEQQIAAARVRAEDLYFQFFSQSPKPPEGQELSACNTL